MKEMFALPMNPAQSWALLLLLLCCCMLVTMLIRYCSYAVELSANNVPIAGIRGIGYALAGQELYEVCHEHVIEVSHRHYGGYCATTTDGSRSFKYIIIPSREDESNPYYLEAVKLADGNQRLLSAILPDSRVKNHFTATIAHEGEEEKEMEFFVVYLKNDSIAEVQAALEKYFDQKYKREIRGSKAV